MADRFFPNGMPDFVQENPTISNQQVQSIPQQGTEESLLRLLETPYGVISEKLKRAAIDLKETIVVETWGLSDQKVDDFSLYTGALGTAFLLFKSFLVTNNGNDLSLCSQIIKACDSASVQSRYLRGFFSLSICFSLLRVFASVVYFTCFLSFQLIMTFIYLSFLSSLLNLTPELSKRMNSWVHICFLYTCIHSHIYIYYITI